MYDTSVLPSRGEYKFTVQALGMGKGMFSRKISLTNRGPRDAVIEQIISMTHCHIGILVIYRPPGCSQMKIRKEIPTKNEQSWW